MKKKRNLTLGIIFGLALSIGMLSGCEGGNSGIAAAAEEGRDLTGLYRILERNHQEESFDEDDDCGSDEDVFFDKADEEAGDELSLAGAWNNDEIQNSLIFHEDGTVEHYQLTLGNYFKGCAYEWDGENVVLHFIKKGESCPGIMNEDGELVFEYFDGSFTRVDEAAYAFEPDSESGYSDFIDESEGEELELSGLAWEAEGSIYSFYDDGSIVVMDTYYEEIYKGTYTWDGQSGCIDIDGYLLDIAYYRGNFFIPIPDGGYRAFTLLGESNPELLDYIE